MNSRIHGEARRFMEAGDFVSEWCYTSKIRVSEFLRDKIGGNARILKIKFMLFSPNTAYPCQHIDFQNYIFACESHVIGQFHHIGLGMRLAGEDITRFHLFIVEGIAYFHADFSADQFGHAR